MSNFSDIKSIAWKVVEEIFGLTLTDIVTGTPSATTYLRGDKSWAALPAVPTLASGIYTPTLTDVANVAAHTAYQCQYMRVGSVVTVSGKIDIDPTLTATSTQIGLSLPVASNLGAAEDCCGTAFAATIATQGAAILGDATNNRAQMEWIAADITNQPMYFTFTYRII